MLPRLFFLALFSAAIAARHAGNLLTDEETLKQLKEEAAQKVAEVSARVNKVHEEFSTMIKDRVNSLVWQTEKLKSQLNKTIKDTVLKGMEKNKPLDAFHCIVDKAREAFEKVDAIKDKIPVETEKMISQEVAKVADFKFIMKEFGEYVEDFHKSKMAELEKASSEAVKKKIIKEVMDKTASLRSILDNINGKITEVKYKFFEAYIKYAFVTSNSLKKAGAEGVDRIKKCVG